MRPNARSRRAIRLLIMDVLFVVLNGINNCSEAERPLTPQCPSMHTKDHDLEVSAHGTGIRV